MDRDEEAAELDAMFDDDADARVLERFYQSPEMVAQRVATLDVLRPESGERVLDVGCGPGLLVHDLALAVGRTGRVHGVDDSAAMIAAARRRATDLAQVTLAVGRAEELPVAGRSFDAVTCVQVLLYVADVERAIAETHRVLRPGGRVVIVDTDWRSIVLSTSDVALTERITAVWDAVVPSPNLPSRLGALLRTAGFDAVQVRAIPVINTSYEPGRFAHGMIGQFAEFAVERGEVDAPTATGWLDDFEQLEAAGAFFCCVNRFVFCGVRR